MLYVFIYFVDDSTVLTSIIFYIDIIRSCRTFLLRTDGEPHSKLSLSARAGVSVCVCTFETLMLVTMLSAESSDRPWILFKMC